MYAVCHVNRGWHCERVRTSELLSKGRQIAVVPTIMLVSLLRVLPLHRNQGRGEVEVTTQSGRVRLLYGMDRSQMLSRRGFTRGIARSSEQIGGGKLRYCLGSTGCADTGSGPEDVASLLHMK